MGFFKWLMGEEPSIIERAIFMAKNDNDLGAYGEYLTKYMFGNNNLKGYSRLLSNIYVPYKNKTSEIDVLLIHEKGIFVIESKNYFGWIFGSENQQYWTQMINQHTKERFYNPIKQNRTHINALSNYLKIEKNQMKSYIVFSERCELKKVPENTDEYIILKRNNLLSHIRKEIANLEFIYTKEQKLNRRSKTKMKQIPSSIQHISI